jgi:hypothetical protein
MGVFDTIIFTCPNCQRKITKQTKAGSCKLEDYKQDVVPVDIAVAIKGEKVHCNGCNSDFTIQQVSPIPETIRMYLKEDSNLLGSGRKYTQEIPSYATVYTIEEWKQVTDDGLIIPYDGSGSWCKDGMESDDDPFETPELDATHVAWYNK